MESLGAVAKNPLGFAKANVAQLPNMVAPMAGMIGLGAAGSTAGPVGTGVGGFTGAHTPPPKPINSKFGY
jgi:hypothetical protein